MREKKENACVLTRTYFPQHYFPKEGSIGIHIICVQIKQATKKDCTKKKIPFGEWVEEWEPQMTEFIHIT